jgi:superfamily II DNA/RNA helicase
MTASTFSDLGASRPVVRALERRGITAPFPIQALVLPDALAGRDVLGRSQTGSGKTLAFGVALVERVDPGAGRPAALVLVPTRELATQVAEELSDIAGARGLRVAAAYGGVPIRDQSRAVSGAHLLVATPGRLDDLASRRLVDLRSVRALVLDEADRMLDMGFQPQVDRIVRRLPTDRQTMFLSATLDGQTGRLAARYTRDPSRHEVRSPRATVEEVGHRFVPVSETGKLAALVQLLEGEAGTALVFVRTRRGVDRLVSRLRSHGVAAEGMHGDMAQAARERALRRFASGRVRTLVATDVAARGLDVERIGQVVNFDPPDSREGYVHRVGRTARAGQEGTGVTFVLPDQRGDVGRIARQLHLHQEFEREGLQIDPPRLVYASRRGRRSQLSGRRNRRF